MDNPDEETFLTTKEAAAILRTTEAGLSFRRVQGGGPRYFKVGPKTGSRVLYRRSDLLEWIEQFQHHSTSEYWQRKQDREA